MGTYTRGLQDVVDRVWSANLFYKACLQAACSASKARNWFIDLNLVAEGV